MHPEHSTSTARHLIDSQKIYTKCGAEPLILRKWIAQKVFYGIVFQLVPPPLDCRKVAAFHWTLGGNSQHTSWEKPKRVLAPGLSTVELLPHFSARWPINGWEMRCGFLGSQWKCSNKTHDFRWSSQIRWFWDSICEDIRRVGVKSGLMSTTFHLVEDILWYLISCDCLFVVSYDVLFFPLKGKATSFTWPGHSSFLSENSQNQWMTEWLSWATSSVDAKMSWLMLVSEIM